MGRWGGDVLPSIGLRHARKAGITLVINGITPTGRRRLREVGGRIEYHQSRRLPLGAMPSLTIIESSVVGLIPRISAAPSFPRTRQPVISSMLRRCSRSVSLRSRLVAASSDDTLGGLMKSLGPP